MSQAKWKTENMWGPHHRVAREKEETRQGTGQKCPDLFIGQKRHSPQQNQESGWTLEREHLKTRTLVQMYNKRARIYLSFIKAQLRFEFKKLYFWLNKTRLRPVSRLLKELVFVPGFLFVKMVVKKRCYGYCVIQSSNQQILIVDKRLLICDVIIFIEHSDILNNNKPKMARFSKFQMQVPKKFNWRKFYKELSKFIYFNYL